MSTQKKHLDFPAIAILVVLCAIWGGQQVMVKLINVEIPPILQSAIRSAGSATMLLLWALARRQKLSERDGSSRPGIVAGILFAVEFALLYQAISYASASRTVVMLYSSPFYVALGAHFFVPGERLRGVQVAGLGAAFIGILIAFADALGFPDWRELIGDSLALAAAVIWATITLIVKASRLNAIPPGKTLLYQLGISALILPVLSLAYGESWDIHPSPQVLGYVSFQIVIVAWISYLVWFWLMQVYPAGRITAFTFLTPLFGMLAGSVFLGERLTPRLGIAAVLVSIGIYLVNRRAPPPKQSASQEIPLPGT